MTSQGNYFKVTGGGRSSSPITYKGYVVILKELPLPSSVPIAVLNIDTKISIFF